MTTERSKVMAWPGAKIDHSIVGLEMKLKRVRSKVRATIVAKRMGVSGAYVSMLESGKKTWKPRTIKAFEDALK